MFFEQLGRGRFPEFQPLVSGYKGRYDLYGKLERRNCVVEFKFDLAGLFRAFSDEKKMFDEINLVVAWDISERDRKLVANRGLTLSAIETGILNPEREDSQRHSGS
jgi:molecular chaperone HtpG